LTFTVLFELARAFLDPIACYPTTYLIGNLAGAPLRIISGQVAKDDFVARLESALEVGTDL